MTDQIIPDDLLHRAKVISGLRQLASYLEAHPGIPVCPLGWDLTTYPRNGDEAASRAEVDRIAALLDAEVDDDTADGGHYTVTVSFGLVSYTAACVPDRRRPACAALMSYSGCVTPDPGEVAQ